MPVNKQTTNNNLYVMGELNVLGEPLELCCNAPATGFYRDGYCRTGKQDFGRHVVCAIVSEEFLQFSLSRGNDLITPVPSHQFPGLTPGDAWCLCANRWREAFEAGVAPKVKLAATHQNALKHVTLDSLKANAVDRH